MTIYDIAREAKVGIGTVSRVLNNHANVSPQTREKVLGVARRLNYIPNASARSLARNRTNTLLAVIPFYTTFFFTEIINGVQEKLLEYDYDLLLLGVKHPDHVETSLKELGIKGKVDGVIFCSMILPPLFAEKCIEQKIPLVLIDTLHSEFDSVTVENFEGEYKATNHLISLGHQKIGMLSANLQSVPARARCNGYKKAMEDSGHLTESGWIRATTQQKLDGFTRESGYQLMNELLRLETNCPTGIVISSDIQAVGALAALAEHKLRSPEDIAIIGFDDIELAQYIGLSTVRQPMFEMGYIAAERLIDRLSDSTRASSHTAFHPELIIRKTCGGKAVIKTEDIHYTNVVI